MHNSIVHISELVDDRNSAGFQICALQSLLVYQKRMSDKVQSFHVHLFSTFDAIFEDRIFFVSEMLQYNIRHWNMEQDIINEVICIPFL